MKKIMNKALATLLTFKSFLQERPKILIAAIFTAITLAVFTVSKLCESKRVIYKQENTGEFKSARIFNSGGITFSDGKDKVYSKTIKDLMAAVDGLKKQVEKIEAKKEMNLSPTPAVAISPPPSEPRALETPIQIDSGPVGSVPQAYREISPAYQPAPQFGFPAENKKLRKGPDLISFPVKDASPALEPLGITLPSGSYVRGKLLTGVDAPEGKPYPVLLQLDFAHILPNDHRVDLSGCFMIAKAQGDLSTERIQMQATKLSCVSKSGRTFEKDVNGFAADSVDSSFAVGGSINSKQDRVAGMAFLASIVEGISKSIQEAQVTKQINPLGGSSTDVSGDQTKHLLSGGAATAAGNVTQWYLKQAEHLLPTIRIGSGQDVWIVMQDAVSLPSFFFKHDLKGSNNEKSYSYVSRLLD